MRITDIRIRERGAPGPEGIEAEVELDGVLTLRGIRVRNSRFGRFLVFPAQGTRSFVDFVQPSFAKTLRDSVLAAFATRAGEVSAATAS